MARVAIVTGGTRGIGEAISIALKDMGMKVAAIYAGNERARARVHRAHRHPGVQMGRRRFRARARKACSKSKPNSAPVDVLVNNAGITRDATMKRMDHAKWQEVIDTNLGGCFNMAKAVFEGMTGRGYGRIVNIGSINGQAGQYGQVNYAAAKSGIHGFTKALAQEGARLGVTVNAIAPGYIDTDMVAAVPEECSARSSPGFPSDASARRTRSRAESPSWSTRMRASSPARRCRSTAASTCIDGARLRPAAETVGADRRTCNIDQPRADLLAGSGSGSARARVPGQCAGCRDRRGAARGRAAAEPDFGDPAMAVQKDRLSGRVKMRACPAICASIGALT